MVRKTSNYPTGVRVRGNTIQIWLSDQNNVRRWLTLPHPPTAQGIKTASETRTALNQKKKWGLLTEEDIALACGKQLERHDERPTFGEYAQMYLDTLNTGNPDTRAKYLGILNRYWMPLFGEMAIADISATMVRQAVNKFEFSSQKTRNNTLIPLRGTFELAFDDEVIDDLPTKRIKNNRQQIEQPDPYSMEETEAILTQFKLAGQGSREMMFYWYYVMAFYTGCRPSELIALKWSDIDSEYYTISISKGVVNGKLKNTTKTSQARIIYMHNRVKEAITALRAYKNSDDIFTWENGERWANYNPCRRRFEKMAKLAKVRYRRAYNCRHTYATIMLMNGVNPAFASNQLGHSMVMLLRIYSKWINGKQSIEEMKKLESKL